MTSGRAPRFGLRLRRLAFGFVGVLASVIAGQARADNLVSVRQVALPSFAGSPEQLFSAAGQPLVVVGDRLWQLRGDRKQWSLLAWRPHGRILGTVAHDDRPYLLLESRAGEGIDRVERYSIDANAAAPALPALPTPLRRAAGAVLGDVLHLFGTTPAGDSQWWSIDFAAPQPSWRQRLGAPALPLGASAVVAQDAALFVTARQADGLDDDPGQAPTVGPGRAPRVDPGERLWRWTPAAGWSERGRLPGRVIEGAARAIGQAHLLFLIRIDPAPLESSASSTGRAQLLTYHTITNAFATQGAVTRAPIRRGASLGDGLVWEQREPGATAAAFTLAEVVGSKLLLRPLDWIMIVLYLVAIAGIGVYCYWREEKQSTSEFFVGNRTIPFWAAAVSLYVTSTSSIGYIATTAKAFATNWQYLVGNLIGVLGLFFVAIWIVPMLRRLRLVSVFDYLEQRFHPAVRMMASAMCIVLHLGGRMSIILFLPALAIATITGFDVVWSILIMGLVTMGYTALGGMRAVIWTDFLQLIVKVGGLVFALVFIAFQLEASPAEIAAAVDAEGKTKMLDWSFDLTQATVWGFIFVVLMETVLTFPKDQVLMQRVFTTKSDKEAGQSVWLFALIIIPGAWLFYLIGTGLWVFYQNNPERMNPLLSVDATFPLFIAAELPAGITGLMIAGIFAASMATCSSIMNSVATMVSVDFYERLARNPTQRTSIRLAEIVTVLAGAIGIGLALVLSRYDVRSYLDVALEMYGLLGGGFGGAYTLGMFTRRANWQGVLIGMLASVVLTFAAWAVDLVHPFVYLGIAILISIVVGYVASLCFPPPDPDSLEGLIVQR